MKQETKRKKSYWNIFEKKQRRTSSENSSSEQSVDNDVVAAKVNYSRKQKFNAKENISIYFGWID